MSRPACMSEPEWATWNVPISGRRPTGHPCHDCPVEFHLEQRAAGTCDGFPLHAGGRRRLQYAPEHGLERRRQQWREYRRRRRETAA